MKAKLKLLNIFYLLFSTVAIAAYFLNSNIFLRSTFNYKVNSDLLIEEAVDEDALFELGISSEDLFSDLDTLIFEVEVNVSYGDLLTAWTETGTDYDNYEGSDYSAIERYAINYVLVPAFDSVPDLLQEDLEKVANAALMKMMDNCTREYLRQYTFSVTDDFTDPFDAMANNQNNTGVGAYNESNYNVVMNELTQMLSVVTTSSIFFDGMTNPTTHVVEIEGFRAKIEPYFYAVKVPEDDNESETLKKLVNATIQSVDGYLATYGIIDEYDRITSINEAIGTILQHLVDHADYEDSGYYQMPENKFVNKLFAPLKAYVDEDSQFENPLTELFINVIAQSNLNGENNSLFFMIALLARVFGVLLILCILSWAIKFITAFISFFRQRPYLRINPFFIITGTIEGFLAILTLASVLVGRYDMETIRKLVPFIGSIVPVGLSIQFIFIAWVPGLIAILNLLFSVLYGPVKRKFKEDSRDEILYSTDFNDYE